MRELLFLVQHAPQTHIYYSFLLIGQSYPQIGVLRYVAVGKLYALGVVVQVVVDVGNVARAVHCERAVGVIVDVACTVLHV